MIGSYILFHETTEDTQLKAYEIKVGMLFPLYLPLGVWY